MRKTAARGRRGTAEPRWGWSGVAPITPAKLSVSSIDLRALLPGHRSPIDEIVLELRDLGARYHRYLHQDELGPTRAERMAALRAVLDQFGVLAGRLNELPGHLRQRLSSHSALPCLAEGEIDNYRSYCNDAQMVWRVAGAAVETQGMLLAGAAKHDAQLMNDLSVAAETTVQLLFALDTTTAGAMVIDSEWLRLDVEAEDGEDSGFAVLCARIGRLRRRAELILARFERQRGPERSVSSNWLVWQLCDLYRRETGRAVTNSAVEDYLYSGTPRSPAGQFVLAVLEMLHPSERPSECRVTPRRARALKKGRLRHAVYFAMRDYVAYHRAKTRFPEPSE